MPLRVLAHFVAVGLAATPIVATPVTAAPVAAAPIVGTTAASAAARTPAAASAATLDDLAWLAGHWRSEHEGTVTEELWMAPAGELMLGLNRQLRTGRRAAFEFLRIEQGPEGVRYVASPGGAPPTTFPLARSGDRHAVFENPGHDWPQVLEYRLDEKGVMHVRAAGLEAGSQELAFTMRRVD